MWNFKDSEKEVKEEMKFEESPLIKIEKDLKIKALGNTHPFPSWRVVTVF